MKITLIAVGNKMPKWVESGFSEYQKRLPPEMTLTLHEIAPGKRLNPAATAKARLKEEEATLAAIPEGAYVIALDERGREFSSHELSDKLTALKRDYSQLALLVGGPEGHTDAVRRRAHELWSLGRLTLPHPLVRVVLAETLYRAYSISAGLPYHRD
ncbi:MAG TPA: 23S rRNA (pseudouridine(1915)-N(3))-methyltransferase RlmH [Candidatus Avisuccinivibrio pullicola]|nr:23S rRNA (pseudouridine(1915)-N(3))-methyltransferase RlmH [Candidatus Avisuccinivibrio pullicola]